MTFPNRTAKGCGTDKEENDPILLLQNLGADISKANLNTRCRKSIFLEKHDKKIKNHQQNAKQKSAQEKARLSETWNQTLLA
ncbi:MAG: hypothetical protein A2785_00015 [Candidatus Chisholmbacteria bacterium RIFCSPHIGHO2_01_FULL_49_18]|uniref:Uncharacterized protein n=2 Tax=Candidatus Chisholmiibacteriota TaxID=1817900 RepID=A0A1G1VLV5_9BACT|nr:MAG: hypothetical protein A2785_00015 [Candidatus Chisholmbacteria bacterium RIFCSPHIGHO2_01_FULL_49_18]OGY19348.1 MAG: hypothetical protein A3A65_03715 [Candidatus Chisholmbacteria bacterium RIFCSPLOWO2_01_FULL_49_14]